MRPQLQLHDYVHVPSIRLGVDNGMDTLVHLDNNLETALQHMIEVGLDGGSAQNNGHPSQ